ncbi:Retinol dehydrogenase 14 [Podila epicladia]|nr:Retinol dehydrogenase 14 [Podila epicladia]
MEYLKPRLSDNELGIAGDPWGLSADGIESHFAVNHLGHFVFTLALLDRLKESQPSRVVVVSSAAYTMLPAEGFDLSTINDESVGVPMSRYGRSKLANILFANALARRLAGTQVRVNSLHPGVVDTSMSRKVIGNMTDETVVALLPTVVSPEEGALTQLYLATSPDVIKKDIRGRYFVPTAEEQELNADALDVGLQEKLWEYSENIVKAKMQKYKQ